MSHFFYLFLFIFSEETKIARPQRRQRRQVDLVNDNIKSREVLLINDGKQEVVSTSDARKIAQDQNLDLVIVQENSEPPVARIMDWGKVKFEQSKKQKEAKKKQKIIQTKEVRISPVIDSGDFETRKKAAEKFLDQGNKVKLSLRFRGRMMAHQEVGLEVIKRMTEELSSIANVESKPKLEGRQMFSLLSPKSKK